MNCDSSLNFLYSFVLDSANEIEVATLFGAKSARAKARSGQSGNSQDDGDSTNDRDNERTIPYTEHDSSDGHYERGTLANVGERTARRTTNGR